MKRFTLVIVTTLLVTTAFAQQDEKPAIKKSIDTFFDAMRKSDTVLLKSVLDKSMVLHSVGYNKDDNVLLANNRLQDFLKAVAAPHAQAWDERITYGDIKVDGNLASVWVPYKFYLGMQFSHCGVDIM